MAKDRKKIVHIHSNIVDKQPTPTSLEYGELSVNYNSGKEFIATRNSDDKVVRFSSDEQIVTIMEKKDVIPYSGTVENIHLDTNRSNIEIKLNQVVANNTVKHDVVNGAKDIDGELVNPTTDGGLTNGAGFAIDMSPYALRGSNPSFSSLTSTCKATFQGTTEILGTNGDCGSKLDINIDDFNVTANTLDEKITSSTSLIGEENKIVSGNTTLSVSGTTTITRDGNVIENNKNNVTINTTGTTNFNYTGATSLSGSSLTSRTTGNTEFKVSGNTRIDTIGTTDIISTGSTTIESKGTGSDMCISAADVAGFVGANKTNIGKNCADGGQTTTLNINGDTINETGNTVNISGSSDVNVSGGTSVNVSGGTNVNVQGGTHVCISAGTKANLYAPETNVGASCEGSTATTVNVSGTTINEGGTNINETFTNGTLNITNYDLNGDKICISGATNANVYGATTNIGTDCDGSTTATTVNISGTTINEGGTTNNNNFTTINTTANTENHTTTSFTVTTGDLCLTSTGDADFGGDTNTRIGTNCDGTGISNNTTIYASTAVTINAPTINITGNTNISGDTVISGTATIGDTLIIKKGLEKTLSWSYGNVQSATSDSTNFKEDKSFVIPQDANEINRRKVSWSYGDVSNASGGNYEPGQSADGSFVIPSCASHINRRTLSWSNGAANTGSYDPGASCDNTDSGTNIVIPSGLSHLTDWSNNCLSVANNLCVNGTVTATGGMYTSSDRDLKENITYIGGHDISKATRIKLKAFNYKNDPSNRKVYGVIAQDLEEIGLNELVHYDESGMRSVDYTGLLLLKLAALEKEIDILKHKLEEKNN